MVKLYYNNNKNKSLKLKINKYVKFISMIVLLNFLIKNCYSYDPGNQLSLFKICNITQSNW